MGQQPKNDLQRIRQVLNATNWDIEWLAERVPALVEEIQWLRCNLAEALHTQDMPDALTTVRPEVAWFGELMEEKLRTNDYKGGWKECSLLWLLAKLSEEIGELSERIMGLYTPDGQILRGDYHDAQLIEREAADVGNVAMMIADLVSSLCTVDTQEIMCTCGQTAYHWHDPSCPIYQHYQSRLKGS